MRARARARASLPPCAYVYTHVRASERVCTIALRRTCVRACARAYVTVFMCARVHVRFNAYAHTRTSTCALVRAHTDRSPTQDHANVDSDGALAETVDDCIQLWTAMMIADTGGCSPVCEGVSCC